MKRKTAMVPKHSLILIFFIWQLGSLSMGNTFLSGKYFSHSLSSCVHLQAMSHTWLFSVTQLLVMVIINKQENGTLYTNIWCFHSKYEVTKNVQTYYALQLFEPLSSGKSVGMTNVLICKRWEIQGFFTLFLEKGTQWVSDTSGSSVRWSFRILSC